MGVEFYKVKSRGPHFFHQQMIHWGHVNDSLYIVRNQWGIWGLGALNPHFSHHKMIHWGHRNIPAGLFLA